MQFIFQIIQLVHSFEEKYRCSNTSLKGYVDACMRPEHFASRNRSTWTFGPSSLALTPWKPFNNTATNENLWQQTVHTCSTLSRACIDIWTPAPPSGVVKMTTNATGAALFKGSKPSYLPGEGSDETSLSVLLFSPPIRRGGSSDYVHLQFTEFQPVMVSYYCGLLEKN